MATTRSSGTRATRRTSAAKAPAGKAAVKSTKVTTRKAPARRASAPSPTTREAAPAHPVDALQRLAFEHTGKLVELQLIALRRYGEAILASYREMASVDDPNALNELVARQGETARVLATTAVENIHACTRLGMDYARSAGELLNPSQDHTA